jgi:L-ascorbate metabolism protein UlaG (beta-lactamase superfamily)
MTDIRFLGQAGFEISDGATRVVIDPFLKPNNPISPVTADELEAPTQILATHAHIDHTADLIGLAKRTKAPVAAIVELAHWYADQGVESTLDPNLGGTIQFDGGWAKLVQAFHTNTIAGGGDDPFTATDGLMIGQAAGWVIGVGETTIYHCGDTCLFGDMQLIGERHSPDVAIIPIGGHYTMDRDDAAYAAGLIGAATVIPCHYDTFPAIEADAEAFKAEVESKTSSKVVVLAPGESTSV